VTSVFETYGLPVELDHDAADAGGIVADADVGRGVAIEDLLSVIALFDSKNAMTGAV